MRSILISNFVLFLATAASLAAANRRVETIQATLSAGGVSYVHVTSGGRLALLGTAIHGGPTLIRYQFAEMLSDDDGDGRIVFEPRGGVPLRSVWIGCDLMTGALSVTVPDEYELDHRVIEIKALKHDPDGLIESLEFERSSADLMVVRPGEGAWLLHGYEGGPNDGDGQQNAKLTLRPENATALPGVVTKAPKRLKKGDVIIAHDPFHLTVRTLTLTK